MLRSLHMKLVLIMVLLIVSLMTVVGAFLLNSVVGFYISEFYTQVSGVFADEALVRDLTTPTAGEESGAEGIKSVLDTCAGALGVDGRTRNYYILDGHTGAVLEGTTEEDDLLDYTRNLTTAISTGEVGDARNVAASYMDVAIPIERGSTDYIIYIYDNGATVESLNSELMVIIIQALVFGLAISVLLSFLLSKTIIGPIEQLTAGAEQVAAGDFGHKLEVASRDEVGVLTGTFNDMAQRLQDTIQQVESERNKLDTLFLRMTDGVVAFSREGGVIHSNPAAGELLHAPIDSLTRYEDLFADIAPLETVMNAPTPPGYLEGEREVWGRVLELLLAPFDRESQGGGVLVVVHDVTEQRKTEEMRKEFVANVSHELRTPLTNILSYAETLYDSGGDLPEETERNFLGVILNETQRMTGLVQDLLVLSRLDSGRTELQLSEVDMRALLKETGQANLMEARRHHHTLTVDVPDVLPTVRADRDRILQVLMNVVSNAIKYTPDGGTIRISAGFARREVWVEVEDNGIGVPPEERSRIFERFYRVDKARARESGGTGLGLSIAKELVERHGGSIRAMDKEGPGLAIRVVLPVEGPSHG
ncbi:MAG: cell wall metabolism sensor histidine kinase WalK [Oscillospiraceae bacterium]|nr:cell wall metabolism sensor histidine kinase WalK [Oscillospiraceae bacterium]